MANMSRTPRPPASPATTRPSTARPASGCCAADAPQRRRLGVGDTRRPGTPGWDPLPEPDGCSPAGFPASPSLPPSSANACMPWASTPCPAAVLLSPASPPRCPQQSSPTCCTSHQAPRSDGCTRQEATGPATPPNSPGNASPDECLRRTNRASTTRHDRNTAGYPVTTPKSRSSSSWPRPGTRTSAPPCATSNPAAKPSLRSPASSAHPAASTKSSPACTLYISAGQRLLR
jgi:hypothetical protein